jgi:hypothetical protein
MNLTFDATVKNFGQRFYLQYQLIILLMAARQLDRVNTAAIASAIRLANCGGNSYTPNFSRKLYFEILFIVVRRCKRANDTSTLSFTVVDSGRDAG